MSLLPERLRELRQKMGRTQHQVADDLQISRKLLSNYECGTREPNIDMLHSLALYYFVSVDYLSGASTIENPSAQLPDFLSDLLNHYSDLSPESRQDLEKYYTLLKLRDRTNQT